MHRKSISSGYGKERKWIVAQKPGMHPKSYSIPLLLLVRNLLSYADNAKETKSLINRGEILVDKKPRRDYQFVVGLMDVVEIPKTKEQFRVLPGRKGLILKKIDGKESEIKLCKILDKRTLKKGAMQLNLHDGSNILVDKGAYKTNDTVILKLPERKIEETLKFDKGATVMVVKGRHSGKTGKIKEILKATISRKSLTTVDDLQTLTDYVFVIGADKPAITV